MGSMKGMNRPLLAGFCATLAMGASYFALVAPELYPGMAPDWQRICERLHDPAQSLNWRMLTALVPVFEGLQLRGETCMAILLVLGPLSTGVTVGVLAYGLGLLTKKRALDRRWRSQGRREEGEEGEEAEPS